MLPDLLRAVVEGRSLTEEQAEAAMRALLAGESTPVQTAALLTALRMKGETVEELAGFARAMRDAATRVPVEESCRPVLDTCGTGGDGLLTFNISTVAAFVVAGAGVRVAKHGNRSISSLCGSADVLEALACGPRWNRPWSRAPYAMSASVFCLRPLFMARCGMYSQCAWN